MANYLLLRNNKESGPFSLDDIIELGLKPYDLIWVQGKSAAWRYPSEVQELKAIAPAVEEQPFDRFYKKAEEKKEPIAVGFSAEPVKVIVEEPITQQPVKIVADEQIKQEIPVVKPEYEKYIPKKSVHVTMPGQKTTAAKEPIKETLPITPVQPTITISENPVAAQIKYSQPLDEIKEMYVKTLNNRKQKIARKSFLLQNMKKAAALLSLVAVGLIAGYFIKGNKGGQKEIALQSNAAVVQPVNPAPLMNTNDSLRENVSASDVNTFTPVQQHVQPLHRPTGGFVNKPDPPSNSVEFKKLDDNTANENVKQELDLSISENKITKNLGLAPQNLEADATTGERNRKVRSTNTENINTVTIEKKSILPNELLGLVSVKSNEYKKVAFGGIRDLQLTVTNDSKYILENVIVELQYIRPNELPLKTENIQFASIAPSAASTIRVPDTNRGIKVVFRIINVKKRQADERVADN